MPRYLVDVHRTFSTCVIVEADDVESAEEFVEDNFDNIPFHVFEDTCDDEVKVYEEVDDSNLGYCKYIAKLDQDGNYHA